MSLVSSVGGHKPFLLRTFAVTTVAVAVTIFAAPPTPLRHHLFRYFAHRAMSTTASDREILPSNVVPRHYRLSLTPDFNTFKYRGEVAVQLDVTQPTQSIILNALELDFHSAAVTSQGKEIV